MQPPRAARTHCRGSRGTKAPTWARRRETGAGLIHGFLPEWKVECWGSQSLETSRRTRNIGSLRRNPSELLAGLLGIRIELQCPAEIRIGAYAVA
jgi:hypothetical protein